MHIWDQPQFVIPDCYLRLSLLHIHLGKSKMNMFYRQTKFDSVLCVLPVREEQRGLQTATDPGNNTFYIFFFFILCPARNRIEVIWFSRGHLLSIVWPAGRCGQVFVQTAAREKTESEWEWKKRESVPEWDSYAEWEMMMRKKINCGPHVGGPLYRRATCGPPIERASSIGGP